MVTVKGVIYNIPLDLSPEELAQNLEAQVNKNNIFIMKASWILNRFKAPTTAVALTFFGNVLPDCVRVTGSNFFMPVESYITPPLRCFKCQGFGHTSGRCQNKESCARCAGDHNSRHCQTESVWCVNCRGSHTARSTRCPVYLRASKVQDCKNARGCSWAQAVELCGDCPFAFATPAATIYNQSNVTKPINPSEGPKFTFKVDETTKVRTLIHTKNDQEVKIAQTQLVSPEVKAPRDSDNLVKTDPVEHNPSSTLSLSPVTDQTSSEPTISESPYKNNYSTPLFSTPPPPPEIRTVVAGETFLKV